MTQLFFSPIRYYRSRLEQPPSWTIAFTGVAACAAMQCAAGYLRSGKMLPLLEAALGDQFSMPVALRYLAVLGGLMGYAALFGVMVLAMLALNVLAGRPGPADRLTEFTALAFYTQVPCNLVLVALMWVWEPETALRLSADWSPSEMADASRRFQDAVSSESLPSTGLLLSRYSTVWLAAQLSIALKVLARLSTRSTAAIALVLALILFAGPIFTFLLEVVR